MSIDEIRENFALLDDWEDRYRYVIELGRELPGLPDEAKVEANKVRGCASQVWLVSHLTPGNTVTSSGGGGETGGQEIMTVEGDSDAFIVRGLIAILLATLENKTPADIIKTNIEATFASLGLIEHLTPQRSNGLAAMIARIKTLATKAAENGA